MQTLFGESDSTTDSQSTTDKLKNTFGDSSSIDLAEHWTSQKPSLRKRKKKREVKSKVKSQGNPVRDGLHGMKKRMNSEKSVKSI